MIVICGDGWVHIFYSPRPVRPNINTLQSEGVSSENGEFSGQNAPKIKTGMYFSNFISKVFLIFQVKRVIT